MANLVYANSEEKFLKAVILYYRQVDDTNYLFYDEEGTRPVYSDDAINLFNKGLMRLHSNRSGWTKIPLMVQDNIDGGDPNLDDPTHTFQFTFSAMTVCSTPRPSENSEEEDVNEPSLVNPLLPGLL